MFGWKEREVKLKVIGMIDKAGKDPQVCKVA